MFAHKDDQQAYEQSYLYSLSKGLSRSISRIKGKGQYINDSSQRKGDRSLSYMHQLKLQARDNKIIHHNSIIKMYRPTNQSRIQQTMDKTPFMNMKIQQKTISVNKRQKVRVRKQRAKRMRQSKQKFLMVKSLSKQQRNNESFLHRQIQRIKQGIKHMKQQQQSESKQRSPRENRIFFVKSKQEDQKIETIMSKIHTFDDLCIYNGLNREKNNQSVFKRKIPQQNLRQKEVHLVTSPNKFIYKEQTKNIQSKISLKQNFQKRYRDFSYVLKIQSLNKINPTPQTNKQIPSNKKSSPNPKHSISAAKNRIKCKTLHLSDSKTDNRFNSTNNKALDVAHQITGWNYFNDHQSIL